jgi:Glycosyl transferases group 1
LKTWRLEGLKVVLSFATQIEWHEGHAIARALQRLGHDVRVVDASGPQAFKPSSLQALSHEVDASIDDVLDADTDLLIYIEPQGLVPRGLERAKCRTVCVLCDTALSLPPRQDIAKLFDDVVLYHRDSLDAFPEHGDRVYWMPFALDPDLFPPIPDPRSPVPEYDLGYVGSLDGIWSERRRMLDLLATRFAVSPYGQLVTNDEMARIYRHSRIVFNLPIVPTITPRVFEAMGAGSMLLTGRADNGLDLLFEDGVHLVTFEGEADLMRKAAYYLAYAEDRETIARAGHELVVREHTWEARLRSLLDELRVTSSEFRARPAARMNAEVVEDIYQRHYKQRGAVEALMRSAQRAPVLSSRRWRSIFHAGMTQARR